MGTVGNGSDVFAARVPRLVREWIADDPSPERTHRRIPGSMLFADVSGFTKMSERLARRGKVGAETIAEVIDACFSRLIGDAYRLGGSLLQFGGDAVLLFFRDEGHERRAAAAALDMRRTLRSLSEFTVEKAGVRLSMTVGVHSGEFDFFLVGRSHRQLIVGGPAGSRLVELEGEAEKGRILIGDETAAALPKRNVGPMGGPGRLLRGRIELPPRPDPDFLQVDHDMRAFVPVGLHHAVENDSVHSEHRTATVAFVEYRNTDRVIAEFGAAEAARRLEALMTGVQDAIDDRDICLQSADLADDGGKFYMSVGAPRSTGHDEEMMLLALREIVDLDVGLPLRAGVNSGSVFTGEIRTQHRSTFITMGDPVNLAARVMSKSGAGQLFATQPVVDRSRTLFETADVPPFMVKGKRRPVTAFQIGPARGTRAGIAASDLPLVGRDAELSAFHGAVDSARSGTGRFIDIVADPGAGKSRLLDQFETDSDGVGFHRVKCRLYQSSTPYFPFTELLEEILGLDALSDDGKADRLTSLVSSIDPELVPWVSLIGVVLGLEMDPSDEVRLLEPEFRKAQLEESVGRLLDRIVDGPTVLCVEDAHWMDDSSHELLDALVDGLSNRPWVVIRARRRESGKAVAPSENGAILLDLQPLGDEALVELVKVATEADPLPSHVILSLVQRSGGNPLFLLELLNAVQAGGDLATMPASVDGLLTARIDRLDTDDRALLRHLAVLGAGFATDYMVDVFPDSVQSSPTDAVRRLEEYLTVDASGWVSFRHNLLRDVAYEGLPFRVRRRLHERTAESMLARVGPDSAEAAPVLSLHFFQAHRYDEAWRYSRLAADRAKEVYANIEAATLYRRALSSATHLDLAPTERASALELLGDVLELSGSFDEARSAYGQGRQLVGDAPSRQATLLLKTAFIDEKLGKFVGAVRSIRRAQRILDGADDPEELAIQAQLAVWYAAIRLRQGRYDESMDASRQGVSLAEQAGDKATLARAYLTLDYAMMSLGEDVDFSASQQALEIYAEIGDLGGEATAANVLGGFAFFAGEWDQAAALYRRSRLARERTGDPAGAALASANLAEILVEQGQLDEAEVLLSEVVQVWRASNDANVAFALKLRGLGRARVGDFEAASAYLDEARTTFAAMGAMADVTETDVAIADRLVLDGRWTDAVALLDGVLSTDLAESGLDHLLPWIHRLLGLARFGEDRDGAIDALRRSLSIARDRGADHDVALALQAAQVFETWGGEPIDPAERREYLDIIGRLGIRPRRDPPRPDRVLSGT